MGCLFHKSRTISSQGRYDHFDTPPGVILSQNGPLEKGENFWGELSPGFEPGVSESLVNQGLRKKGLPLKWIDFESGPF